MTQVKSSFYSYSVHSKTLGHCCELSSSTPRIDSGAPLPENRGDLRVAAVIVLFHPHQQSLEQLFKSLADQVASMFVIDNTPSDGQSGCPIPEPYNERVVYFPLRENRGIATAQNLGIRKALSAGHSHVLLLDQDSLLPELMVSRLLAMERQLKSAGKSVAAVGPVFIDQKTGEASRAIRHLALRVRKLAIEANSEIPVESDYIISSGSLISAEAFKAIGFMDEELFIDWVDIEWGLRGRSRGYKCYVCPDAIMLHSIGDTSVKYGAKSINLHSDVRNYYIVRNAVFLLKEPHMGWQWRSVTILKIPQYVVFYSTHSKHPFHCLSLLFRAISDGCLGKLGRLE